MTDEIDRSIRDEVMTLESNGSLWVLAEDYRALLARAEAAEAAGEQAKTLYRESLRRAEKAEIASANHAQFSHEWRGRAEAAEAELHKERARVLSLESEVAALRETHRADIAAGADLETKLATAREALVRIDDLTQHDMPMSAQYEQCVNRQAREALDLINADTPTCPAPVPVETLEPVDRALRHIEGCLTFPVATEINERGYDTRTPTPETVQYMVDLVIEARAALRTLAGERKDG